MENCKKLLAVTCTAALLTACGGSNNSTSTPTNPTAPTTPTTPTPNTLTGTFIDSKVSGLSFKTDTQEGMTQNGEFTYVEGETVEFKLGDILLGSTPAKPTVTPFDLGDDDKATNIGMLLQSLDKNFNPADGIDLTHIDKANTMGQSIDMPVDQAVIDVIAGGSGIHSVRSRDRVQEHLRAFAEGYVSMSQGAVLTKADITESYSAQGIAQVSTRYGHWSQENLNDLSMASADLSVLSGHDIGDGRGDHRIRLFGESSTHGIIIAVGLKAENGELKRSYFATACELPSWSPCNDAAEIESSSEGNENMADTPYTAKIESVDNSLNKIKVSINGASATYDMAAFLSAQNSTEVTYQSVQVETRLRRSAAGTWSGTIDNIMIETGNGNILSEDFSSGEFDNPAVNYVRSRI